MKNGFTHPKFAAAAARPAAPTIASPQAGGQGDGTTSSGNFTPAPMPDLVTPASSPLPTSPKYPRD
jgi:hypothetical protein